MKKIILFLFCLFMVVPNFVLAQYDCPFGEVNDPSPGNCVRFIDQDGNDLCDLSEVPVSQPLTTNNYQAEAKAETISEEALKQSTVEEVAALYGINAQTYASELSKYVGIKVNLDDSLQVLHDQNGLCSGVAGNIALALKPGTDGQVAGVASLPDHELISGQELKTKKVYEVAAIYNIKGEDLANAVADQLGVKVKLTDTFQTLHDNYGLEPSKVKETAAALSALAAAANGSSLDTYMGTKAGKAVTETKKSAPYKFLYITILLTAFYLLTSYLVKAGIVSELNRRRFWNILLMLTFLTSAILGVLLVIRINWGWYLELPFNLLYWHVELGTAMAVITVFHTIWHWRYFTVMLKRGR